MGQGTSFHTSERSFRAVVHGESFDILVRDKQLFVNDEEVACSFEQIAPNRYSMILDGMSLPVFVEETSNGTLSVTVSAATVEVNLIHEIDVLKERFGVHDTAQAPHRAVRAPMPGLVLDVRVERGTRVHAGDRLVVLEAMKMENDLRAQQAGTVRAVHVRPGDAVARNALLIEFEAR